MSTRTALPGLYSRLDAPPPPPTWASDPPCLLVVLDCAAKNPALYLPHARIWTSVAPSVERNGTINNLRKE